MFYCNIDEKVVLRHNNPQRAITVSEDEVERLFYNIHNDNCNDCSIELKSRNRILEFYINRHLIASRSQYFRVLFETSNIYANYSTTIMMKNDQDFNLYKLIFIYLHYGHMVIPAKYPIENLLECYRLCEMYVIEGARRIVLQ